MDILGQPSPGGKITQKIGIFEHTCLLNQAGDLQVSGSKVKVDIELMEGKSLSDILERVKQDNLKSKILKKQALKPGKEATIKLKYLI